MILTRPAGAFWKVAHRGGAALAGENTLVAVRAALDLGIDMVELDVVAGPDGLRLAHAAGQLRPESPALEDALAFFAADVPGSVALDLDLKTPGSEAAVLEGLRRHRLLERTLLTSFQGRMLRAARRLEPRVAGGLSYPNDRFALSSRRAFAPFVRPGLRALRRLLPLRIERMVARAGAGAAMLHHDLVAPALVGRCHRRGIAVFAWTVETEDDLRRVLAAGVDGVIANDPRLFDG